MVWIEFELDKVLETFFNSQVEHVNLVRDEIFEVVDDFPGSFLVIRHESSGEERSLEADSLLVSEFSDGADGVLYDGDVFDKLGGFE